MRIKPLEHNPSVSFETKLIGRNWPIIQMLTSRSSEEEELIEQLGARDRNGLVDSGVVKSRLKQLKNNGICAEKALETGNGEIKFWHLTPQAYYLALELTGTKPTS